MRVLIFQTGEPLRIDGSGLRVMRAENLATKLKDAGHTVVIVSTRFYHQKKVHRKIDSVESFDIDYHLIDSPGYVANIGFARFYDHFHLANNLGKFLTQYEQKPDVVFIGFPPIESAFVMARWCVKNAIPYVVDVKDLWPQIFIDVLPKRLRPIGKVIFSLHFFMTKWALKNSNAITSISQPFLDRVLLDYNLSGRATDFVSYLTAPISRKVPIHEPLGLPRINEEHAKMFFAGSLSRVFDFSPLLQAIEYLDSRGINILFYICGDGPFLEETQEAFGGHTNVIFTGWIDNFSLEYLATKSVATLAPYRHSQDFEISIPNKVIESLSYGLPVLHSLKGEVDRLLSVANAGIYFQAESLGVLIEHNYADLTESDQLRRNAKKLYDELFDYDLVYNQIESKLASLVEEQNDGE